MDAKLEARGKLKSPENPEAVVAEGVRVNDAQLLPREIISTTERIQILIGRRIPGDRVDGEVPPASRIRECQVRVATDGETAVPAAGLRFAAG